MVTGWLDRFIDKVSVRSPDACWPWQAGKNGDGYGRFQAPFSGGKKTKQAHHVAWFLRNGWWPKYLAHSCDNPACVNPAHLREATHQENIRECWSKGRGRVGKYHDKLERTKEMLASGARNRDIVKALGVPNDYVSRVRHGLLYRRYGSA